MPFPIATLFVNQKGAFNNVASGFEKDIRSAKCVGEARAAIDAYSNKIELNILQFGLGFYAIKVGNGKTSKSFLASISIKNGDYETSVSKFYAPLSQLVLEKNTGYLPRWLVKKSLGALAERGKYKSQRYERIPFALSVWPQQLKNAFLDLHLSQLPNQNDLDKWAFEKEEKSNKAEVERNERYKKELEDEKLAKKILAERMTKSENARKGRMAKLETYEHVDVRWYGWTKKNGRFIKVDYEAENVTVKISGARAYIIF